MAFMIQIRHPHIMPLYLIQHLVLFANTNGVLVIIAIGGLVWLELERKLGHKVTALVGFIKGVWWDRCEVVGKSSIKTRGRSLGVLLMEDLGVVFPGLTGSEKSDFGYSFH